MNALRQLDSVCSAPGAAQWLRIRDDGRSFCAAACCSRAAETVSDKLERGGTSFAGGTVSPNRRRQA